MLRYFKDLMWILLTVAVVGVVWAAAQDLYYGGGPLMAAGVSRLASIFVYLIALVFLYSVVTLANST